MTAFVALLRAVNVAGNNVIRMADLKATCEKVGFRQVKTVLQSGNVAFLANGTDKAVAKKLAAAIEVSHGFRPAVVVRTAAEIAGVMKRNPFKVEEKRDPGHLLVAFMAEVPPSEAGTRLAAIKLASERLHLSGRELYVHYAGGVGKSKLTNLVLERAIGVPNTARNWNTVTKLLAIAESIG